MGPLDEKAIDPCLLAADRQITLLKSKILSSGPFLLLVDDQTPHLHVDFNQYRGTPFEPYEVRHLQYLTMVKEGNRGLAHPCSDWHDEIESCSPAAIELQIKRYPALTKINKVPSKKISIVDYKKLRQDSNSKASEISELRSRASSIASSEPMSRGPSFENTQDSKATDLNSKARGAGLLRTQLAEFKAEARRIANQKLNSIHVNGNHVMNKNTPTPIRPMNDPAPQKSTLRSPPRATIKHPLPPRPQSPRRNSDNKLPPNRYRQQKRPLDHISSAPLQTHKRPKNEIPLLSSTTKSASPWKDSRVNESKALPASSKAALKPPSSPTRPQRDATPIAKKSEIKTQNLLPIPPLLSPLPAYLDDSAELEYIISNSVDKINRKLSPPINVGQVDSSSISKSDGSSSKRRPRSSSPVFVHPPLLSPDLPPIVEQELSRLQKKSNTLNSIEARHEKVRQPDTPGVARKTAKVGHPPKKSADINKINPSMKSKTMDTTGCVGETEKSFLVKIKYKKRKAKDIERILRMTPKVLSARFQELEAQRLASLADSSEVTDKIINDSKVRKFSPIISSSSVKKEQSKKRSSESSGATSPPIKRAKISNNDTGKSRSSVDPLKSPAFTAPSKNNLSTPENPHSKEKNIRKFSSTDNTNDRSPSVSTPVPAEKRLFTNSSGVSNSNYRADPNKYISEALLLKRKMDSELKTKDINARQTLSDLETQAGLCTGIECLLAYYSAFSVKRENRPIDRATNWESTLGLLEFVFRTAEPYLLLQTLAAQLNALVKEELNRSYMEHVSIAKEAPSELLEKIVKNSQSRDRYWSFASRGREVLQNLGFYDFVGPWTTWRYGREYFLKVLGKYEAREKLGWKASFE